MSTQIEVPGKQGRPTTVTYAAYAQFAVGGLALIATVISIVQTMTLANYMQEELKGAKENSPEEVDAFIGLTSVFSYALLVVALLFALTVALLGVFNLKGKNGSRITTWVLAGLGLLCGICGSIGGATSTFVSGGGGGTGDAAVDELNGAMERAYADVPGWYDAVGLVQAVLSVVLYLAIIILLAVPASNDFFRKPKSEVDVMLPPEAYMDQPPPAAPPAAPTDPGSAKDDPEQPKP